MNPDNAAAASYRAMQVETATPAQLIAMLYDALVGSINRAATANESGQREEMSEQLQKAQDILLELRCSLKLDAGDVAKNLDALYEFGTRRLVEANIQRDNELMHECIAIFEPIRDAWREACVNGALAGT